MMRLETKQTESAWGHPQKKEAKPKGWEPDSFWKQSGAKAGMEAKLEVLSATEDSWLAGSLIDWLITGFDFTVNLPLLKILSRADNIYF